MERLMKKLMGGRYFWRPFCSEHRQFKEHRFDREGYSKFVCPYCGSDNTTNRLAGDETYSYCGDCEKVGA